MEHLMAGLCSFSPNALGMKSSRWSIHRQNRVRYSGHVYSISMCSWTLLKASVCRQPSAYCLHNLADGTTEIFILSYNFVLGILLNALSKSTKKQYNGWPISQLSSSSTHRQSRWSIVMCLGQKPVCCQLSCCVFHPINWVDLHQV